MSLFPQVSDQLLTRIFVLVLRLCCTAHIVLLGWGIGDVLIELLLLHLKKAVKLLNLLTDVHLFILQLSGVLLIHASEVV